MQFDPLRVLLAGDQLLARLLHAPLFDIGEDGSLQPRLAADVPSFENGGISRDHLTIRYRLRHGLRFSDGRRLTAADVVATFAAYQRFGVVRMRNVVDVRQDGDDVVIVRLRKPSALVLLDFFTSAGDVAYVLEGGTSRPPGAAYDVGAGPFKIASVARSDHVSLVANKYSWPRPPSVAGLRILEFPDANTRRNALLTHHVDVSLGTANGSAALRDVPGMRTTFAPMAGVIFLTYATFRAPFDDVDVRRAFDLAIDRTVISGKVFAGQASPATDHVPPGYRLRLSGAPAKTYRSASLMLLDRKGWLPGPDGIRQKSGRPLSITLAMPAHLERVGLVLQAMFREIGADVTLRRYPPNLYYAPKGEGGILAQGKFDLAIVGSLGSDLPREDGELGCERGIPTFQNVGRFCAPSIISALGQLDRSFTAPARSKALRNLHAALQQSVPVSYLYHPSLGIVVSDDLQDVGRTAFTLFSSAENWHWAPLADRETAHRSFRH